MKVQEVEVEFSDRFLFAYFIPAPTEPVGDFQERINKRCARQSSFINPVLQLFTVIGMMLQA